MTTYLEVTHFVWMGLALWFAWRVGKERRRANRLAWWLRSLAKDGEAFFTVSDIHSHGSVLQDRACETFDKTLSAVEGLLERDPETKKKAGGQT